MDESIAVARFIFMRSGRQSNWSCLKQQPLWIGRSTSLLGWWMGRTGLKRRGTQNDDNKLAAAWNTARSSTMEFSTLLLHDWTEPSTFYFAIWMVFSTIIWALAHWTTRPLLEQIRRHDQLIRHPIPPPSHHSQASVPFIWCTTSGLVTREAR